MQPRRTPGYVAEAGDEHKSGGLRGSNPNPAGFVSAEVRPDGCLSVLVSPVTSSEVGFPGSCKAQVPASPACAARPRPHPWRCVRFLKKVSTTYINVKSLIYEVACMCKSRNLEDPKPTRHRRKGDELHLATKTPPKVQF